MTIPRPTPFHATTPRSRVLVPFVIIFDINDKITTLPVRPAPPSSDRIPVLYSYPLDSGNNSSNDDLRETDESVHTHTASTLVIYSPPIQPLLTSPAFTCQPGKEILTSPPSPCHLLLPSEIPSSSPSLLPSSSRKRPRSPSPPPSPPVSPSSLPSPPPAVLPPPPEVVIPKTLATAAPPRLHKMRPCVAEQRLLRHDYSKVRLLRHESSWHTSRDWRTILACSLLDLYHFDHGRNSGQQQSKRRGVVRAHAARPGNKKEYAGTLPNCNKCKLHHAGPCIVKCEKCKRIGHMTRDCRTSVPTTTQRPLVANKKTAVTCIKCENQGHYRSECLKLKKPELRESNQKW
ncbi:reverse transcriptase domain-containing protein [Tanacetum coccineum]